MVLWAWASARTCGGTLLGRKGMQRGGGWRQRSTAHKAAAGESLKARQLAPQQAAKAQPLRSIRLSTNSLKVANQPLLRQPHPSKGSAYNTQTTARTPSCPPVVVQQEVGKPASDSLMCNLRRLAQQRVAARRTAAAAPCRNKGRLCIRLRLGCRLSRLADLDLSCS